MADLLKDATEDARLALSIGLKFTALQAPNIVDEFLPQAIFRDAVGEYPLGFVNVAALADDVFALRLKREWFDESLDDVKVYKLLLSFGDGLRVIAGDTAYFVYRMRKGGPVIRVIEGEILSEGLRGCTICRAFMFSGLVRGDKGGAVSVERFGTLGDVPDALVPLLENTGKAVCDLWAVSQ
jgi:hypothetical protein